MLRIFLKLFAPAHKDVSTQPSLNTGFICEMPIFQDDYSAYIHRPTQKEIQKIKKE